MTVQVFVIAKTNFIHIKKTYAYLHYAPNMFTKYEQNDKFIWP